MIGGGAEISELNPNPFETGLRFNFSFPFEFETENGNYLDIRV